ncbi:MAG: hypothetical protein WCJ54_02470 [Actinomycetota bacterium]
MGYKIYESMYKDQRAIAMESGELIFKLLPDFGGNIASVMNKKTSREFMVQRPEPGYRVVPFDGSYVEGECSGLDDMFPTIDICHYEKEPWTGVKLADHGEVWNIKAETQINQDSADLAFYGVRLPYVLEKHVHFLSDTVLRIDYKVTNHSRFDMEFLWAAHTMLNAEPGVKILVPQDLKKAISVFTNSGRIGRYGEEFDWPEFTDSNGIKRKVDIMPSAENNCEKYYFKEALTKGWCAVQYPDNTVFALSFPAKRVPYLGILHNPGSFRNIYNVFLEPCTATFDRPDFAAARGQSSRVNANSVYEWYLNITVGNSVSVKEVSENGKIEG